MNTVLLSNEARKTLHAALDALMDKAEEEKGRLGKATDDCLPEVHLRICGMEWDDLEVPDEPTAEISTEYGIEIATSADGKASTECSWVQYDRWSLTWNDETNVQDSVHTHNMHEDIDI